ncbi:MAG TPA: hypothetical protein VE173_16110 [Longimicrobiales bacterium]|nr:hypothetical protein [Longimicrobiales bacterium]
MTTTIWLILVAVALVLGVAGAWFVMRRRRREHLKARFGPEYDRTVRRSHGTREAEKELEDREERVEQLHIHPLTASDRTRFTEGWRTVQSHFVDEPEHAVGEADELVQEVMERRGYPIGDFEQRAADVSVHHPTVVSNYRAAHAVATRSRRAGVRTEDLRQAMVHYRALFDDLLEPGTHDGHNPKESNDDRRGVA